jgi:hypothetical protein
MSNNITKLNLEKDTLGQSINSVWLRIRLIPGMEALAQELGSGRRIYQPDWEYQSPTTVSPVEPLEPPMMYSPSPYSPESSPQPIPPVIWPGPMSPEGTNRPPVTRMRSKHWNVDGTGAFPTLFLPEDRVLFYSDIRELKQGLADQKPGDADRIMINIANVVAIERINVLRAYGQNIHYGNLNDGRMSEAPITVEPLTITYPTDIPTLNNSEQELFFKINVKGGVGPYRYSMVGQPPDLYVTTDGWVRGYIEESNWPRLIDGDSFREFRIVILVEDASTPCKTTGLEVRYRLYPQ